MLTIGDRDLTKLGQENRLAAPGSWAIRQNGGKWYHQGCSHPGNGTAVQSALLGGRNCRTAMAPSLYRMRELVIRTRMIPANQSRGCLHEFGANMPTKSVAGANKGSRQIGRSGKFRVTIHAQHHLSVPIFPESDWMGAVQASRTDWSQEARPAFWLS